jgi:transposase
MSQRKRPRSVIPRRTVSTLERICPDAAGIDCGAAEHYVAVPPDRDPCPVQVFSAFTHDLHRLADWLQACRVTTVAMEATGVYWIPLFTLLETRGVTVLLVNARHVKNVAGRKSDVSDCEWLRDLLMVGLLRGSFRPPEAIVALRSYVRHRDVLIQSSGQHLQRMQKALLEMNVQLPRVVSDIGGVTGLRIIRDIVAGHRDPAALAAHRDPRCRASLAEIEAALTGTYRAEQVFILAQNLALFDLLARQLVGCDQAIEAYLVQLTATVATPTHERPAPRVPYRPKANEPRFDVRSALHHLTGADLSQIDGLGPYSALRLIGEIGTDMSRWPTEKHFTSWLTLAPHNRISGGRLLSSRTAPSANRAASILRMSAMAIGYTETALGAFYRRLALRIGKARAITATARKLAVLVYRTLKDGLTYVDPGARRYTADQQDRLLRRLHRQAQQLGFTLVNQSTGEVAQNGVS